MSLRMRRILAGLWTLALVLPACTGAAPEANDDFMSASCSLAPAWSIRLDRGLDSQRSPDVVTVPRTPNFYAGTPTGGFVGTTHSGVWGYLQRVPLVWYGPGFIRKQGLIEVGRDVTLADVAPTQASLLGEQLRARRDGRPLAGVTLPLQDRAGMPALIVTVVWDGGGWNVLDKWAGRWPFLRDLMREGSSVSGATVGSSPSVTPSIHATLGTGAYPRRHGITDVHIRTGNHVEDSWRGGSPKNLRLTTLSDLHDLRTANKAKIGMIAYRPWHLGMIGHGAWLTSGDRDIAVMWEKGKLYTQAPWYALPKHLQRIDWHRDAQFIDRWDGMTDSMWRDHDVLSTRAALTTSPAWPLYQARLVTSLIEEEGFGADEVPDLLYVNFKQIDIVGHEYNMLEEEVGDAVEATDIALRRLVRTLDAQVGQDRWVVIVTADHGQQPDPLAVGGWPIATDELTADLAAHLQTPLEIVQKWRPAGVWLDHDILQDHDATLSDVAGFLTSYTLRENSVRQVPQQFTPRLDEPIFDAVFPKSRMTEISTCNPRQEAQRR